MPSASSTAEYNGPIAKTPPVPVYRGRFCDVQGGSAVGEQQLSGGNKKAVLTVQIQMAAVFLRHLAHQRHAVAMLFAGTGAGQAVVSEQNLSLIAVAAVNPQPLPREFHAEGQQLGLVLAYGSGYHGVVQQIGQIGGQV